MPIASGAAGRVDVGGEASTTWSPDGLKRKPKAANKSWDSYLLRYKELNKRNKSNVQQVTQEDNTEPSNHENEEEKDGSPMTNGGSEGHASEEPSSGENSKKSQMCVLL